MPFSCWGWRCIWCINTCDLLIVKDIKKEVVEKQLPFLIHILKHYNPVIVEAGTTR